MRKVDNKPKLERQTPLALTTGDNCGRTINPTSIVPRWRRERDVRIRCNLFRPDSLGNTEELVKKEHGEKRKKGRKKGTREAERFANQGRTRREAPGIPGRQMRRREGGGGQKAPSLSRFDPASPADRIFPARCAVAHARYSRNEGVRAA